MLLNLDVIVIITNNNKACVLLNFDVMINLEKSLTFACQFLNTAHLVYQYIPCQHGCITTNDDDGMMNYQKVKKNK